ncbi:MAG: hypothetical protein HQ461_02610 [Deltaproteobacteria bacterium]|nr:hypothetical protein [Deltaproteobacteria bacterium]
MQTATQSSTNTPLSESLAQALPAHELLTVRYDETGGESLPGTEAIWVHVQGRGDRLHAVASASGLSLEEAGRLADALHSVAANWRWLAADSAPIWLPELCKERGLGLLSLLPSGAERSLAAPPAPGIFLPRYPSLRAEWKKLASW